MASNPTNNEKSSNEVTFGAVVNTANDNAIPKQDTTLLTPTTPSTPFYDLPSAQPSLQSLPSKKEPTVAVYEADLESGRHCSQPLTPLASNVGFDLSPAMPTASYATTAAMDSNKRSFDGRTKECTVWPTKETLREQARVQKAQRQETKWCGSMKIKWDNMTKRQRLYIRLLVLLVIIALAVGVGVGVSRAVHGGVYAGKGESHTIPDPQ